jgi:hypothetical protein
MINSRMQWIVLVRCAALVTAVILLPMAGIRLGTYLSTLLVSLCPLAHIGMMAYMGRPNAEGSRSRNKESWEKASELIVHQLSPILCAPPETASGRIG